MKIQIASDLHLEFKENRAWVRENPLIPAADLLILAGDTVPYIYNNLASEFMEKFSRDFKQVFSIFGNHEFYRGEISHAYPSFDENTYDNYRMVNNVILDYEDVRFIFTTLWSYVPLEARENVQNTMNDYRVINKRTIFKELQIIQIEDMLNYFEQSLTFLKKELQNARDKKVIVVTHHVPVMQGLLPYSFMPDIKFAYGNDLEYLILENPQIKYWICGHSHKADLRKIGDTTLIRNPLGYVFQNQHKGFKRNLVIEI